MLQYKKGFVLGDYMNIKRGLAFLGYLLETYMNIDINIGVNYTIIIR